MVKKEIDPEAEEKEKLEDLQKRYRLMEGDRKSYSEESQNIIRKQRYVNLSCGTAWRPRCCCRYRRCPWPFGAGAVSVCLAHYRVYRSPPAA